MGGGYGGGAGGNGPSGGAMIRRSATTDSKGSVAINGVGVCGGGGSGGYGGGGGRVVGGEQRRSDWAAGDEGGGGGRDVTRLFRPRGVIEFVYRIQKDLSYREVCVRCHAASRRVLLLGNEQFASVP